MNSGYVLITPVRDEARFIGLTLESVIAQTLPPLEWIIVDDGSSDGTGAIVEEYLARAPFLRLVKGTNSGVKRDFASKAKALRQGYTSLLTTTYRYICFMDADVSFDKEFFRTLDRSMERDATAGLIGGLIHEPDAHGEWHNTHQNPAWCVGGADQFFRRECFEQIGGYLPLGRGGEDTIMEYLARARGWNVYVVYECPIRHHKPTVIPQHHAIRAAYNIGIQEYSWGSSLSFQFVKCIVRAFRPPGALPAMARFLGFLLLLMLRTPRDVSDEIARIVAKQQHERLVHGVLHLLPRPQVHSPRDS